MIHSKTKQVSLCERVIESFTQTIGSKTFTFLFCSETFNGFALAFFGKNFHWQSNCFLITLHASGLSGGVFLFGCCKVSDDILDKVSLHILKTTHIKHFTHRYCLREKRWH